MKKASSNAVLVRLLFLLLTSSAMLLICLTQEEVRGVGIPPAPEIAPVQDSVTENPTPTQNSALLPESWARKSAMTSTMPTYPQEAIRLGISGVVYIRFETSPEGEVVRIKVKPTTHPLLSKAVVDAVKDWRFRSWRGPDGLAEPVFSRLAFSFVIVTGIPNVGMHSPEPRQRATECLECSNSNKEMIQWRDWDEAWSNSHERVSDSPSAMAQEAPQEKRTWKVKKVGPKRMGSKAKDPESLETDSIIEDQIPPGVPIKVEITNLKTNSLLHDIEIKVTNTAVKPIYYLELGIVLPDNLSPDGYPIDFPLQYGRPELIDIENALEPNDTPLLPGESFILTIPKKYLQGFEMFLAKGKITQAETKRVYLMFRHLNFGDTTGFSGGGSPIPNTRKERSANDCYKRKTYLERGGLR